MNNEITLKEAALAWAQGKRVEACSPMNTIWRLVTPVGASVEKRPPGQYSTGVFTSDIPFLFRLAPEPPAKKWRPWKPEEVPVGALIRAIGLRWRSLIWAATATGQIECMTGVLEPEYALLNHEHSLDNGKTWLPCGVEVEA